MKRALILGALAACGGPVASASLATMHDQADIIETAPGGGIGTVGRAALAGGETIDAESVLPGQRYPMNLRGLVGGRLCFTRNADAGSKNNDTTHEQILQSYASARYAYLQYGSLAEITAQTGWPEPSDKLDVTVLTARNLKAPCHAGQQVTFCREDVREVTLQLCTTPPVLAAGANFLGLVIVFDDASRNRLVAWKLTP
jgi:hypothetical protein